MDCMHIKRTRSKHVEGRRKQSQAGGLSSVSFNHNKTTRWAVICRGCTWSLKSRMEKY